MSPRGDVLLGADWPGILGRARSCAPKRDPYVLLKPPSEPDSDVLTARARRIEDRQRRRGLAKKIRILIVDDHALVRRVLCDRLQREPDFVVVGQVSSANEAVASAIQTHSDVVLLDIDMSGSDCLDAARQIGLIQPKVGVVLLTSSPGDLHIDPVLASSADGLVTKCDPPDKIVEAIREVASGRSYFSNEAYSRITVDKEGAGLPPTSQARLSRLTPRELEVLRYIASGMSQKEIAASMKLSVKTVGNHCTHVMNKLNIHNRVELARLAIREGIAKA